MKVKNGIITLKNGDTIEFSKRRYGTVVVINGSTLMSRDAFAWGLTEAAFEHGGYEGVERVWDLLGLNSTGRCPLCDGNRDGPPAPCPHCSIGRCPRCAAVHDDSPLCRETRFYAETHRLFRNGETLNDDDTFFARKHLVFEYLRQREQ